MDSDNKHILMLTRIDNYINNVDAKASISLAFISIIIGIFFTVFLPFIKSNIIDYFTLSEYEICNILKALLIICIFAFSYFCIRSIVFLFKVITPDTNIANYENEVTVTNSTFFFGTIANITFVEFQKQDKNDAVIEDIQSQIYINSKICSRKFVNYSKALFSLKLSVILLVLSIVISAFY